jgi:hypothetical protein
MQQLISYIAPGAPATRRPATGREPFLRPEIGFTPAWYLQELDIDFGERWHTEVSYRRDTVVAMRQLLRERFPGTSIGGIDREDGPLDLLTGVYGAGPVSAIFGLPLIYAHNNWPNVSGRHLTMEQVKKLEAPNLDNNPFFEKLMQQVDEIEKLEGAIAGFINWQGVLNNAQRLRGQDLFMDLFTDPEACHHLFAVISDTMIDGIQRLHARQRQSGVDYTFATVSNCLVNMIAPEQYAEFLLPYDIKISKAFDCIGVHNCAWSATPYLDAYKTIPNLAYIDMGMDSDLERARSLMPHARRALMYTPMDLRNKTEAGIRADFERLTEQYAPCDIVLADIEAGTPDERVMFAIELCRELSAGR